MKFVLLSDVLPPAASGQAMVIHRLLDGIDPASYCLVSRRDYDAVGEEGYSTRLPAHYYYLPDANLARGYGYGLAPLHSLFTYHLMARLRARKLAEIVRREGCTTIIACTDNFLDLPTGFAASRLTGARFYAYIFDDYSRKWDDPRVAPGVAEFARRVEPKILKNADGVIVPNEFMRDELRRRYRVEPTVVHNPCELSAYEEESGIRSADGIRPAADAERQIVYTGAVYTAHYDAFRNLMRAIELLDNPNVRLHLYTSQPQAALEAEGLRGSAIVYHPHEAAAAMPCVQRAADVLFLPLAFDSMFPELIRTSAPGKIGEYLAARRPVLVHAPKDSFVAWYFRTHVCGIVVDESDPAQLAQALERLLEDEELCDTLSAKAWRRAQEDFSREAAQSRFAAAIALDASGLPITQLDEDRLTCRRSGDNPLHR